MRIFKNINKTGKCLICNTDDNGEVCLIGTAGTEDDNIMEAKQVHIKCLELYYYPNAKIIGQNLK